MMRFRKEVLCSLLAASLCCTPILSGCASNGQSSASQKESEAEEHQASSKEADGLGDSVVNLGEFSIKDINDNTYTQEMFADYDLTMINVFTTWCTPCINEIPDLGKLYEEMKGQGVNIVGIALDAVGSSEKVEKAKLLAEKTGVSYPFLIPDEGYLGGRLAGINAVPETFFVDKEGNIVGETYSGSRSYEDWKLIIENELKEAVK